jgi:hypothetical protein
MYTKKFNYVDDSYYGFSTISTTLSPYNYITPAIISSTGVTDFKIKVDATIPVGTSYSFKISDG